MHVERINGRVDEYPEADSWVIEDGNLTLSTGDHDVVTYASGQWVRVFNPEGV